MMQLQSSGYTDIASIGMDILSSINGHGVSTSHATEWTCVKYKIGCKIIPNLQPGLSE